MINNRVKYGLRALVYLSNRGRQKIIPSSQIAAELNIPKEFVSKILQSLTKIGFVESKKGKGGGFSLAKDPYEIKISDLFNTLGYANEKYNCLFEIDRNCGGTECEICNEWHTFNNKFSLMIKNYTVGNFSCLFS